MTLQRLRNFVTAAIVPTMPRMIGVQSYEALHAIAAIYKTF